MSENIRKKHSYKTRFSFGSTSAIITNLGLIAGLQSGVNAKISIISGILVIAIADNISDSFGIHIFQESQCLGRKEIWWSTLTNFMSRLIASLTFVFIMVVLPLNLAVVSSIAWGLFLLAGISYIIALDEERNPYLSILNHLLMAIAVAMASKAIGSFIMARF